MPTITRIVRKSSAVQRPAPNPREILLQMSDEDLMSQFQAGTVEAFNILIDRFSERLMHFLY